MHGRPEQDDEWRDTSAEIAEAGRAALAALEREGAELAAVKLPIARHAAKIGYLTIGPESLALHRSDCSLQILGDAWDEAGVLAVLAHLERVGVAVAKRPRGGVDLLG